MNEYQALQTLNLNSNSSFKEVKYAYRKLALELHPDKNSDEADGKKFKKVTTAYHVLKNNNKKMNSNGTVSTKWYNSKSQSKTEQNFRKKKPQWGAGPERKTPEEDWGRFTKDFEESNPNFWKKYEEEPFLRLIKFLTQLYLQFIMANRVDKKFPMYMFI